MPLESPKAPPLSVGDYDLVDKIADGGMGSVYRGRHRDTGQIVASTVSADASAYWLTVREAGVSEYERPVCGPKSQAISCPLSPGSEKEP